MPQGNPMQYRLESAGRPRECGSMTRTHSHGRAGRWAEVTVTVKAGRRQAANRPAGVRGLAPEPVAHSRSIHP